MTYADKGHEDQGRCVEFVPVLIDADGNTIDTLDPCETERAARIEAEIYLNTLQTVAAVVVERRDRQNEHDEPVAWKGDAAALKAWGNFTSERW